MRSVTRYARQGRHLDCVLVAPAAQGAVHCHPSHEALLPHQLFEFLLVAESGVVVLEEVHRIHEVAAVLGKEIGEHRVRAGEHILKRVIVDLHELAALH